MTTTRGSYNKRSPVAPITFFAATRQPDLTEALCRTHDEPDLWTEGHDHHTGNACKETCPIRITKTICNTCPVRDPCLQWAYENPDIADGVCGATTAEERAKHRNRTRKQQAA